MAYHYTSHLNAEQVGSEEHLEEHSILDLEIDKLKLNSTS
jgi:hypothetical protein